MKICRKELFPCVFQSIGGKRKEAQRADNTQRKRQKKKKLIKQIGFSIFFLTECYISHNHTLTAALADIGPLDFLSKVKVSFFFFFFFFSHEKGSGHISKIVMSLQAKVYFWLDHPVFKKEF